MENQNDKYANLDINLLDSSQEMNLAPLRNVDMSVRSSSVGGALFRRENMIGSAIENYKVNRALKAYDSEEDENFNAVDATPIDLIHYTDRFLGLKNQYQVDIMADAIREELRDKQLMADHPWQSFYKGFVIGNLDPSILLPGSTIYKAIKGARGVARGASAGAIANTISSAAQETVLLRTQQTREVDEAVFNVAASALFGASIGGLGSAISSGAISRGAKKQIIETYADGAGAPKAVGADVADLGADYLRESESFANLGRYVGALGKKLTPFNRLANSPFGYAKEVANQIFDSNIIRNKNLPEYGSRVSEQSVELKIKDELGKVARAQTDYQEIFFEQAGVAGGVFKAERAFFSKQGLNYEEFNSQVADAIRDNGVHANPTVAKAAKLFRDRIFEPIKNRAIELNALPKNVNVKTALAYLTRIYDTDAIKLNEAAFKADIKPWFEAKNQERIQLDPQIKNYEKRIKAAERIEKRAKKIASTDKKLQKLKSAKKPTGQKELIIRNAEIQKLQKELDALINRNAKDNNLTGGKSAKQIKEDLDNFIPFDLKDSDGNLRAILDADNIEYAIDQTYLNIISRNASQLANTMIPSDGAKPLNNRVFLIPDELIKKWLVNDASKLADIYSRSMIPTLEMMSFAKDKVVPEKRNAKRDKLRLERSQLEKDLAIATEANKPAIETKLAEVNEKINQLEQPPSPTEAREAFFEDLKEELAELQQGKSEKERVKLEKEFDSVVDDVNKSFEILMGRYSPRSDTLGRTGQTISKNVKLYNLVRLLGAMVVASLADLSYSSLQYGPLRLMKEGMFPILKALADKNSPIRQNLNTLKDINRCMEAHNGVRLKSIIGQEGAIYNTGLFSRGLEYVSEKFGNASIINHWNDMMQFLAGNMAISTTLRDIDVYFKTGKMSKKSKIRMNAIGIDEKHWKAIHEEWKKHGGISDGSYYVDIGNFNIDNPETAAAYGVFRRSILHEVDSTAVLPGAADKPLIAYDPILSHLLTYKQFMMASTNKILTAGLSRNDAEFYMGAMGALSMGAMVYVLKSIIRDPEAEVDLSWKKVMIEAIDWSGLAGIYPEFINAAAKVGGSESSRYQSRSIMGALGGPAVGLADDLKYVVNKMIRSTTDDDVTLTTNDAEKLRRLLPYTNLFYLNQLTKKLTKSAALELGFEES